ncbi:MAG: DUF3817 domain-containing protein [bacterium]|nr:DUF3817 domain-containing protein [bacterium]
MQRNPVPFLRKVNIAEAISYVLLVGIAMPLKYIWDEPMAVKILGWIHGLLFAVFGLALVRVLFDARWPLTRVIGVFLASLLPVLPFFIDRYFPAWIAEFEARQPRDGAGEAADIGPAGEK